MTNYCSILSPASCDFVSRIIKVLVLYKKWREIISANAETMNMNTKLVISLQELIANDMNGYHLVNIMDDYQHLLRIHSTNTLQMEQIHDEILFEFGEVCHLRDCKIYQRNNRRNIELTTNEILNNTYEMCFESDICLQQKLDVIHCFCVHCFEVIRLTSKEEQIIENAIKSDENDVKGLH